MQVNVDAEARIAARERARGGSRLGLRRTVDDVRRLLALAGSAVSAKNAARFLLAGLAGLAVDVLLFDALILAGIGLMPAHVASFAVAAVANYALNLGWTFAGAAHPAVKARWGRHARFLIVALMALFLRDGFLAAAVEAWRWPPALAILPGGIAAAAVGTLGNAFFVFAAAGTPGARRLRWHLAAIGMVAYVVVLRLVFLGLPDLMPEEAYYWNYAQHLDIGYLDHPPMVAWLIWLGTTLFGNTEFGVRIGAFLCWFAAAYFCFRLTRNFFGRAAAFAALLLVATLPYFFAAGLVMLPDAPLTAAWAGALYFLERALLAERRAAWWGVGACIGLGMISKYTIALLGPATLALVLLDPRCRRWLWRPEPYAAILLALLIFSPVVLWNATHDWASFAFQSSRRLEGTVNFSLHHLLASMAALLTPVGLVAVVAALLPARRDHAATDAEALSARRRQRFILLYTLVPLSVFVAFSLAHSVKLNWTGPLWLAVLPAVAAQIVAGGKRASRFDRWLRWLWGPTIAISVIVFGIGLDYLVLGLPGVGYSGKMGSFPIGWEYFGRRAEAIEARVERETGQEPLLVGMDGYFIASQLAFYRRGDHDGVANTAGRGLFGDNSLMYNYWFPPESSRGRTVIMFGLQRGYLDRASLKAHFSRVTPIKEEPILRHKAVVGRFYYRIGYDFKPE